MGEVNHPSCRSNKIDSNHSFPRMDEESFQTFLQMYRPELRKKGLDPEMTVFGHVIPEEVALWHSTMRECPYRTKSDVYLCDKETAESKSSFDRICRQDTGGTTIDFWMFVPPRPVEDLEEGRGKIAFDSNDDSDHGDQQVAMKEVMEAAGIDKLDNTIGHFYGCDRGHQTAINEENILAGAMGAYAYREAQKKYIKEAGPPKGDAKNSIRWAFKMFGPTALDEHVMFGAMLFLGGASNEPAYAQAKLAMYYYNKADALMAKLHSPNEDWDVLGLEKYLSSLEEVGSFLNKARKWVDIVKATKHIPMTDRQYDLISDLKGGVDTLGEKQADLTKKATEMLESIKAEEGEDEKDEITDAERRKKRKECRKMRRVYKYKTNDCGKCKKPYVENPKDPGGKCIKKAEPPPDEGETELPDEGTTVRPNPWE